MSAYSEAGMWKKPPRGRWIVWFTENGELFGARFRGKTAARRFARAHRGHVGRYRRADWKVLRFMVQKWQS